ncbi:MAG: MucR family transcriptional regulator [Alphaproteobacteria bacterium]|nr:MucR family transcriptional regulator [Alphaproteobacteria bacterium]
MPEKISHEKAATERDLNERLLALAAQVVAAHVGHNTVPTAELPSLISTVYQSMSRICSGLGTAEARTEPAVPVRRSVTPEYIICLEDGKKLKMLKRHLKTSYNLTPDQYRERWGLPADYPMVAPNYAKQRSKLAKQIGLGTSRRTKRAA